MMAKRPQDRYQTPGEVAGALVPFASPAAALPEALAAPTAESLRGSDTPTKTWAPRRRPRRDDAPPLRPASGPHPWPGRRLLRAGRRSCSCPMAGVRDAAGPARAGGARHLPGPPTKKPDEKQPGRPDAGKPVEVKDCRRWRQRGPAHQGTQGPHWNGPVPGFLPRRRQAGLGRRRQPGPALERPDGRRRRQASDTRRSSASVCLLPQRRTAGHGGLWRRLRRLRQNLGIWRSPATRERWGQRVRRSRPKSTA